MDFKAVFGLGNPGDRYLHTRHNVGAEAVLAYLKHIEFKSSPQEEGFSLVYSVGNQLCVLPQTYMNLSGVAVADVVNAHRLNFENCLIAYDDVSLPFGHLRLRPGGSSGGQNGMASVIEHLHSEEISRLRIGIGNPIPPGKLVDYVLSPFSNAEREQLPNVLQQAASAIECFMKTDLLTAMNRFNGPAI